MIRRVALNVVVVLCVGIASGCGPSGPTPAEIEAKAVADAKAMKEAAAKNAPKVLAAAKKVELPGAKDQQHVDRAAAVALKQGAASAEVSIDKGRRLITIVEVETSKMGNPKAFAQKTLLAIRNDMAERKAGFEDYRVTVHGPSPGPGLVLQFGSMRFSEGGSFDWSPSK
jgi:hypothetical protein